MARVAAGSYCDASMRVAALRIAASVRGTSTDVQP